ncbi:MAG: type 4a pilus biogenesis protein PilO [Desulfotignum sp.]|nr:type 4a pilus biogenesis protein PilO [Desulfotignum sp.]MCF8112461.1 type 4a pilus biogenesis protein PilO [Desulfotignum sp.]MCF8124836.1 type 4a pilus biogenesis protein PilO [Desulfotignum sp.]
MAEEKKTDKSDNKIKQKLAVLFERVGKLSRRNRLFICLGTLLLIGGGYYYFIFMPKYTQLQQAIQTLETQSNKLNIVKRQARELKKWETKMAQVEEAFYTATRALPDKKELPSLLDAVSKAGSNAGLNFLLFQPDPEINREFYKEIPLSMKVEGTYHQIADFFFQVSRLNRIVNIRNISLRRNKSASGMIDMSCNAVTYMFVEADQDPKQNKKKG